MMKYSYILLAFISMATVQSQESKIESEQPVCKYNPCNSPDPEIRARYNCYRCGCKTFFTPSSPFASSYTTAGNWCRTNAGRMVQIRSRYEQECINEFFDSTPLLAGKSAWIGLRTTGSASIKNLYKWDFDGTAAVDYYENFIVSPVAQPDWDGQHAHIWGKFNYEWNNYYHWNTVVHGEDMVPLCEVC